MIVVLDQRALTHKKTSGPHPEYGLHMIQNGGDVQFYRTVNTNLPKLCTAQLRRHSRQEFNRANGDRDYLAFYQVVYKHTDGTLFADTFGDDQWGFPGAEMVNPFTYATITVENFGTTLASEYTKFGTTIPMPSLDPSPEGHKRIGIKPLLDKLCDPN